MNSSMVRKIFSTMLLAAFILILSFLSERVNWVLDFSRDKILSGEIWRCLTGHFVHLNLFHTTINLLAFFLIGFLVGSQIRLIYWFVCVCILAIGISLLLLALSPQVHGYVGLSGVLHGMLALGLMLSIFDGKSKFDAMRNEQTKVFTSDLAAQTARRFRFFCVYFSDTFKAKPIEWMLLLGLAFKIIREQAPNFDPNYMYSRINAPVIVDGHFYGFSIGLALSLIFLFAGKFRYFQYS